MAALVMLGGLFDLVDGLWTHHPYHLSLLVDWLPLEVHQGSRALLVLSGIVMISLGRGLGRGKRRAWELAMVVVSVSLLLHLSHNRHAAFLLPAGALLVYLILARKFFIAGSDPASTRRSLELAPILFAALIAYGSLGQYRLRRALVPEYQFNQALSVTLKAAVGSDDLGVVPITKQASAFLDSIAWLAAASAGLLVWLLLRPVILRRLDPDFAAAHAVVLKYGNHSLAPFAAEPYKNHFLAAGGRATVAYRVTNGVAITVGDPIGPEDSIGPAIDEFLAHCRRHDWMPCFYEVKAANLDFYGDRKLRALKIAEEAVIPLADFTLRGTKMQKIRQSLNKVEREHPQLRVEFLQGEIPSEITDQLQEISETWLGNKGLNELGFTMGRFDPAKLAEQALTIAVETGEVVAFVSWRRYADKGLTLDLMRYSPEAPKFIMDVLIARSLEQFKSAGYRVASLANAPLANVSPEDEFSMLDRGVRLIFEKVHGIYEYKSLFQFKKKFNPNWEARYLVFPSLDALPRIAVAMMRVHRLKPLEQTLLGAA
jgi:phosphatidylglycerol lysyltransferase